MGLFLCLYLLDIITTTPKFNPSYTLTQSQTHPNPILITS